jgi:peptide subunit release factor 1 (eRF1)
MYRCDKHFHTEYISDLFNIHKSYGYVVVTSVTQGTKRIIKFRLDTEFSTGTRREGQSAVRIERLRDEQKHVYKIKVLEACINHLQHVEGIIEIKELISGDSRILVPLLGFIRVSNTASFEEIINQSLELIQK